MNIQANLYPVSCLQILSEKRCSFLRIFYRRINKMIIIVLKIKINAKCLLFPLLLKCTMQMQCTHDVFWLPSEYFQPILYLLNLILFCCIFCIFITTDWLKLEQNGCLTGRFPPFLLPFCTYYCNIVLCLLKP